MLKSKTVAKLIETTLNYSEDEKFRVVYGAGSYKGAEINCILKQGKGTTTPIANYTNVNTPFTLEVIVPMQCGEDRVDTIVNAINDMIKILNGKIRNNIDNGKAVFLFSPLEIGSYETRATTGQSVIIRVEFSVEYSTNVGTKYEMALINNPFDVSNINTRYFKTQQEQLDWFINRKDDYGEFTEILTPNINGLVITQQRYLNSHGVDVPNLLMKNYAIIKETKWNDDINYYFYYITNSNIDAYNLLVLDLKLDTVQTVYFNPKINIPNCMINRAHLRRLYTKNNIDFMLDFNTSSALLERETITNVAKRPTKNQKLCVDIDDKKDASVINNWFEENVSHWVYYYLSSDKDYILPKNDGETVEQELKSLKYVTGQLEDVTTQTDNNIIDSSMAVLCCPVYKTDKKIYLPHGDNTTSMAWDLTAIRQFLSLEKRNDKGEILITNGYADVYAIKNSVMPPFDDIGNDSLDKDSDGNLVYKPNANKQPDSTFGFYDVFGNLKIYGNDQSNAEKFCFASVLYQNVDKTLRMYTKFNMYNPKLTSTEIKNNKTNIDTIFEDGIEPKLLNEDFCNYRLYIGGNTYDLPISKTSARPVFLYKEILSPDITKAMLIYDPQNSETPSNVFTDINTKDFTGFMINLDLSMWFATDRLDEYLASNKNNLQILLNNQTMQRATNTNNLISNWGNAVYSSATSGSVSPLVNAGVSTATQQGNLKLQQVYERLNYSLTLDNMAQSPQTLSSLNSNALLMQSVNDLGIYIELQEPLRIEKQKIVDNFKRFGYSLEKIDNIKNYDNIRHDYNYIEADIEQINGMDLSSSIIEDIRQRFSNGIRFWNGDIVDYNLPNYENGIEIEEEI